MTVIMRETLAFAQTSGGNTLTPLGNVFIPYLR